MTVLERAGMPGGRAGVVERDGFVLDNGPAVLTMPNLIEGVFNAIGASTGHYLELRHVDPMYRVVFADGSVLRVRHGREAMAAEIAGFAGPDAAASFARFADWAAELYRIEMPNFIDAQYDSAFDLVRRWRAALRLTRLGGFRRLGPKVASFFADERLQRAFSFQALYAGVPPALRARLVCRHLLHGLDRGCVRPGRRMHALASGFATAVEHAGVTLRYDASVGRICAAPTTARSRASNWPTASG